jgi:hypothetical protein
MTASYRFFGAASPKVNVDPWGKKRRVGFGAFLEGYLQIIHFHETLHYKPSINWEYPHLWNPPFMDFLWFSGTGQGVRPSMGPTKKCWQRLGRRFGASEDLQPANWLTWKWLIHSLYMFIYGFKCPLVWAEMNWGLCFPSHCCYL